ncbi:MAG TPA: hypothetical protein VJQ82_08875 [Terriglobales bacterium]|nr:hypothetical protein [Terriglobales bacterium]
MATPTAGAVTQSSTPSSAQMIAAARARVGAKWFYWIAGLSLLNSVVMLSGGNFHFVVGLGITSVVDAIAKGLGSAGSVLDIVINAFVAGVFCLFGYFACKLQKWAFFAGMALYVLDAVLLLWAQDLLGVAFHAYALFAIYRGLSALNQIPSQQPIGGLSNLPIQPR